MARGLIAMGLVAAGAALATACGADPTLDAASVEEGLDRVLFPDDPSIVAALDCPEPDIEVVAQSLVCTATLHGEPITVDAVIAEDGAAEATIRERLLDLAAVEQDLAARVEADIGVEVGVRCPASFVVDRAGIGFECTVTRDGEALSFRGEIVDDDSGWTVELVD